MLISHCLPCLGISIVFNTGLAFTVSVIDGLIYHFLLRLYLIKLFPFESVLRFDLGFEKGGVGMVFGIDFGGVFS